MANIDHLLLRQKNELFKAIQSSGMSPTDFTWVYVNAEFAHMMRFDHVPALLRTDTSYYFAIAPGSSAGGSNGFVTMAVPGRNSSWERFPDSSWRNVLAYFGYWLASLKGETEDGDLRGELESQRALLQPVTPQTDNSPFTPQEQARIAASLDSILTEVEHQKLLSTAQYTDLAERIDHARKAAGWLGRVDWTNAFAGAVMGHVVTTTLTSPVAQQLIHIVTGALGWLAHPAALLNP